MRTRVLVVAQQTALRAQVARLLVPQGCQVEIASTEKSVRQLLAKEQFDAAVIAPSSIAARELAFVRDVQNAAGRLLILAADPTALKQFAAYFPEAIVCASHPLDAEILLRFLGDPTAKQSAGLNVGGGGIMQFEGCRLDVAGHIFIDAQGREVALTRREFALLVALVGNPGRVLSRSQLRQAIDGGSADAYDRSVDMLIARLRRKIEPNTGKPQFIVTVAGGGYKFVPRVRDGGPAAQPTSLPGPNGDRREASPAERRPLSVLSCQILGFAALAAISDPEDLQRSVSGAYVACAEIIARFGGTMVSGIGDHVLAYFGHPAAHENDAENAVRAALELVHTIPTAETISGDGFRARIGIATGVMLVGDLRYGGVAEPTAVGEALNLALHLQHAAAADSVVIAARTRQLIGSFFNCSELAPLVLEEGLEPVPAWQVIDENAGTPRFDALRRDGMVDLVGRQAEAERLLQFWAAAQTGRGQVVLLSGEAGIGKSRLVLELEERIQTKPHVTIRYSGSPHRSETPLAVLFDELQVWANFTADDTSARKVEKLQRALDAINLADAHTMALVSGLLGLPFQPPAEIGQLSPQKRKERTFEVLLRRIEAIASRQPVMAVVEDVHWADPTSLEFLTLLVERASALRLLLLIVTRPEFAAPWPDYSYVTALTLSRLGPSDSATLIHYVAQDRRVPAAITAEIAARADGVPLFIEELTKSVLETRAGCVGRQQTHPRLANASHSIPTTLHGLFLARFDRLEGGKDVAQAGAVVGREFSYEVLRTLTDMDEPALLGAIDRLVVAGLIFRRGSIPQANFIFKHALVRDAAYDMMTRPLRQKLHGKVAQTLESGFPDVVQLQPELLAYHHREAGNTITAASYLIRASERALLGSATTEALSHLAQGRDLLSGLPESRERLRLELMLEITRGRALIAQRGYTAAETRDAYDRARQCCEALGDQSWLPLIISGQWAAAWNSADHQSALAQAKEMYAWGERNTEPAGRAAAHLAFGLSFALLGRLMDSRRHFEQALQIDRFTLPSHQPFLASDADGRIACHSYLHDCLLLLGLPEQAAAAAERAAAEKPTQLYSLTLSQLHSCRMRVLERDVERVAAIAAEALRVSEMQGYPYFAATMMVYRGWAAAHRGEIAEGIEGCRRGIALLSQIGATCWFPRYHAHLAECHYLAADSESGLRVLHDGFAMMEATGERVWEAELHRLKAEFLRQAGEMAEAKASFRAALAAARRQDARLFELRAATSLAGLVADEGGYAEAHDMLARICSGFAEGFENIDLRAANALLHAL